MSRADRWGSVVVAVLSGLLVLLALFPSSGAATQPPECFAFLFYTVPCEPWVAPLAAAVIAGLVWWAVQKVVRPRAPG
jgi:hypothetical protein